MILTQVLSPSSLMTIYHIILSCDKIHLGEVARVIGLDWIKVLSIASRNEIGKEGLSTKGFFFIYNFTYWSIYTWNI